MTLAGAFLRLVRFQNLLFILLTQTLFYTCIYLPLYGQPNNRKALLLMLASVFIAAAGYIINDYFDLNIDRINKPDKNLVDKMIPRRWAIVWHLSLSLCGVLLTAVAVGRSYWFVVLANLACVLLLWLYSTSFKKQLLIGNLVISLLTAWTILVFFFAFSAPQNAFNTTNDTSVKFFRLAFLYAGFAFIISLVREAIKDMEDMEGDQRYGCKTLPILTGIRTTKLYVGTWLVALIGILCVVQFYVLQFGWWHAVLYALAAVVAPLVYTVHKLRKSSTKQQFATLSGYSKGIILTGILSMVFFYFYF